MAPRDHPFPPLFPCITLSLAGLVAAPFVARAVASRMNRRHPKKITLVYFDIAGVSEAK